MTKDKNIEKTKETKDSKETKETKETKDVKKVQDNDDEKTMNKNTAKANLRLDVNSRKRWLNSYYKRKNFTVKYTKKDKDEDTKETYEDTPMISGAQYALTATEQVLMSILVNMSYKKAQKTTEGLYNITEDLLTNTVSLDSELNLIFGQEIAKFDSNQDYFKLLEMGKKDEVVEFVEKYACDSSKVHLTDGGMNFLMFLLNCNRVTLANCAYWMVKYSKKRTVDNTSVTFAVKNHYNTYKKVCEQMCKKLDEVASLVDEANKAERDAKKEKEERDEKEDKKTKDSKKDSKKEDKKDSKKEDKKESKKKDKKSKKDESESESDSGSGSDSD